MSLSKNIMWSPKDYSEAAVIAGEAGVEMLSRLEFMTIKPNIILDIGCGTAEMGAPLKERYPDAQVLGFDCSLPMLEEARVRNGSKAGLSFGAANTLQLPLRNHSIDMIFANFLLPWQTDIQALLQEWRRVLRPDGLLMFSALGPDTLKEWRDYLQPEHIPQFVDMHDVGDVLLQAGYADPVLDVNYYTTSYRDKSRFINELCASGMWFPGDAIHTDLPEANTWDATYEVVIAHAFAPQIKEEHQASADGIVRVPISALRKQLREK